jgi:hypothetical protein
MPEEENSKHQKRKTRKREAEEYSQDDSVVFCVCFQIYKAAREWRKEILTSMDSEDVRFIGQKRERKGMVDGWDDVFYVHWVARVNMKEWEWYDILSKKKWRKKWNKTIFFSIPVYFRFTSPTTRRLFLSRASKTKTSNKQQLFLSNWFIDTIFIVVDVMVVMK